VRHPSKDLKTLTWDNGLSTKTLYPRGEEEKLHVVFADSDMQQIAKDTRSLPRQMPTKIECIGRKMVLERENSKQNYHASNSPEYYHTVSGGYCMVNLFIHIEPNYLNIRLTFSRWDRIVLAYKRRPSIIRFVSRRLRNWLR
jgi:hypothetical protein